MGQKQTLLSDLDNLVTTLRSAAAKMKVAFNGGPESPDVGLTPAEATVVYRLLTEQLGLSITEKY